VNKRLGQADERIADYVYDVFAPQDGMLADVAARSALAGLPEIQVAPLDALHLEVIARAMGARRAVEIGTLGGYSGLAILRGMGPGGVLHTFELDLQHADVAAQSFRKAGFGDAAHIHVGPALERLGELDGEAPFDLVFIDADKVSYPAYVEWAADHLRVGGAVLCDNAFLFGRVTEDPASAGDYAEAIRAMRRTHEILARGGRFRSTMLPTGEGMAFGVKLR
jgi:predicted O-methyltransferase YrrM